MIYLSVSVLFTNFSPCLSQSNKFVDSHNCCQVIALSWSSVGWLHWSCAFISVTHAFWSASPNINLDFDLGMNWKSFYILYITDPQLDTHVVNNQPIKSSLSWVGLSLFMYLFLNGRRSIPFFCEQNFYVKKVQYIVMKKINSRYKHLYKELACIQCITIVLIVMYLLFIVYFYSQ